MSDQTIVVVGGGTGGIVAANRLRRSLSPGHRVVLIEKNAEHSFAPSFLWVMTGGRKPAQATRPLRSLVARGVEIVSAEAVGLETGNRQVATSGGAFTYDHLVLALGAALAPQRIPGLKESAHSFYTLEDAVRLRDALAGFDGGEIVLAVSSLPYKCPGAPHEAAMLVDDFFKRRSMRDKVKLSLYTPEAQPMGVAGPRLGEAVAGMLSSKGISFRPGRKPESVDPEKREIRFEDGESVPYDLLICVPPHTPPSLVAGAGLANEAGWVQVDRSTLATGRENVYAIGDMTSIAIPGRWKADKPLALPKAGVFAHAQAEVVARRIVDTINGRSPAAVFSGPGYCMLEAGGGRAGFASGDFYAEPAPRVEMRNAGRVWHWGKVLFEHWWLAPPGPGKTALGWAMKLGGALMGIPVEG